MKKNSKITFITLTRNIDNNKSAYEATISVNNEFTVQVSGDENEATFWGITHPTDKFHNSKNRQLYAYNNLDNDDIEESLEYWGFENNLGWLEDHANVILD